MTRSSVLRRGTPWRFAPLALTLAALVACDRGPASPPSATRTDSAGVTLVVNDSADRPLGWTFTSRFALGGEESGPESFYGVYATGVGTDARGNLFVLDAGNHRVLVFDSARHFVRAQGGKGGGPGELQFPGFLVVAPDGVAGVFDYSREGLVRWSAAGEPLPVQRAGETGGPPPQFMRALASGWAVHVEERGGPDSKVQRSMLQLRAAPDSGVDRAAATTLVSRESPAPPMHMYKSCSSQLGMSLGPLFEPKLVWAADEGRVLMARDSGYVIDVHDGSRQTMSIRRPIPVRRTTREMAVAELGEGMRVRFGSGECTIDPAEVIEARGIAPVLQAVGAIVPAPDGTIWVRRGAVKDEPRIVDVFDRAGEYLGTLPGGSPVPVTFLPSGDLVAIEKDDLDVERLVVYRVSRDADAR